MSAARIGVADLLRQVQPHAVTVDDNAGAGTAADYAGKRSVPVLHLLAPECALRVGWRDVANGSNPSPGTVRNTLAGALLTRGAVEA